MNIFACKTYRDVIEAKIIAAQGLRGYRAQLAKAAGCQRAYLSQVMKGDAHLTADHAVGLAKFWDCNEAQTEYFLNLLHYERAAQKSAKRYFLEKIESARKRQNEITRHLPAESVSSGAQAYYANGLYAAIHVLLSIPEWQSEDKLAQKLRLTLPVLRKYLEDLRQMGVIKWAKGIWQCAESDLHISKDSLWYFSYACQWRMTALQSLQHKPNEGLHYTALHALSFDDAVKVREEILRMIQATRKMVEPSLEEVGIALVIDCFEL